MTKTMTKDATGAAGLEAYRPHNAEMLTDWLIGSPGGVEDRQPPARRESPYPTPPTGAGRRRRGGSAPTSWARHGELSDADVRLSEGVLGRVAARLRREHFDLYYNLVPVFFSANPKPSLLSEWREAAGSGDEMAQARIGLAEKAISWMLDEAERGLAAAGRRRLVVPDPEAAMEPGFAGARVETERQRKRARASYYRHRDLLEAEGITGRSAVGEATRRACAETGYNEREMRRIRNQAGAA